MIKKYVRMGTNLNLFTKKQLKDTSYGIKMELHIGVRNAIRVENLLKEPIDVHNVKVIIMNLILYAKYAQIL